MKSNRNKNEQKRFSFQKYNKLIIFAFSVLTLFCLFQIPKLKAVYNFQDFLVDNDPELAFYEEFNREFGSDNEIILIGISQGESVYKLPFLKALLRFTDDCNHLDDIENAYSLATIKNYHKSPLGILPIPFIHLEDSLSYSKDSIRIGEDERLKGWVISEDSKSVAVIVQVKNNLGDVQKDGLITQLDSLIHTTGFKDVHIAGNINTEVRYVRMIGEELSTNVVLCSVVIFICLILFFNTKQGVILPSIAVLTAMLMFYGGLSLFNQHFNLLSTLFPTILMIVGISSLIHFFSRYHYNLKLCASKEEAIIKTYKELVLPLFITSTTTAIGFFSLVTASIKPIRSFGIEAGIAVLLTFIISIVFIPAILLRLKRSKPIFKIKYSFNWSSLFEKVLFVVEKWSRGVIVITIFIMLISFVGILYIDTNTFILNNFTENSDIKRGFNFFENNLSGIRSMKVAVLPQNNRRINDVLVLQELDKLHTYMTNKKVIDHVFSSVTTYKSLNKIYGGGSVKAYTLPKLQSQIDKLDKLLNKTHSTSAFLFSSEDKSKGLIIGKIGDVGSDSALAINNKIDHWIDNNLDSNIVKFKHTGIWYLTDKSNDSLAQNMLFSLAIAFFMVGLIMALLFKNLKLIVISLVTNVVPLVIAGGVMGFVGITLNASSAVVFTIGFVIAVDDTVHFLSKLKKELGKQRNYDDALRNTLNETGKGIVITTIVLFLGFLVLLHSEFKEVYSQGVLFCVLLVSALLSDLFILPLMLNRFMRR